MNTVRRSQSGATMVEFAIVLPLLLMLVLGTIEFGRAYNAKISVTHAAREGVREYSLTQDAAAGTTAANNAATSLNPDIMSVQSTGCSGVSDFGEPATLRVSYPFDFNIPFVNLDKIDIKAEGVMRCGG